jgi:predicted nucleic acid-binding protein
VVKRTLLLDTSFIVALENRRDPHQERAKELDRELLHENCLSVLHWGILLEIGDGYARVGRRAKGIALLDRLLNEERYRVFPLTESLLQRGLELYFAHADKDWGLTDCVSFSLMAEERISEALTADGHFRQAGFTALLLDNE